MVAIHIASDFSRFPGGRYRKYGDHSGEEFREDVLLPKLDAIDDGQVIEVDLSNVFTFPPSFLDEAFAAIIRNGRLSLEQFNTKIQFRSDELNEPYLFLIQKYLKEASSTAA